MTIKALVAVRSGSVRVKNKNIRPFAGSTLLEVKLAQLRRIKSLDGIIVNSNDDFMLNIAADMGCETVKRDEYYAGSSVSMSEVYRNMAENADCDIIAYTNCTNPLITDETLETAIHTFMGLRGYDSLNSAHLVKEFLFLNNRPVNYDLRHQPRSQDLPDYYALNFAVSIISRENMIACMNVVGRSPFIYAIDELEATDIDNPIDFDFAEYMYVKLMYRGGGIVFTGLTLRHKEAFTLNASLMMRAS